LKGFLKNLICEKKKEFGLDDDCYISDNTIHFRVKNKIFTVDCCRGHSLPLKDLEDTIINILIKMSQIRQLLTTSESLVFVNSLIQGSKFEHLVTAFQAKYCNKTMKETTKKGEVGLHFWQNFMR